MKITKTPLQDLLIITPNKFVDNRGYFYESYQQQRYTEMAQSFVQDNISHSKKDVLRGLHYQYPRTQGKLVWTLQGQVLDVAVDLRRHSSTFGQSFSIILGDTEPVQLYVPPGFAHGFCVLSEEAYFYYKCTDYYAPEHEKGIIWNDPDLNIHWPTEQPILSEKDKTYPRLCELTDDVLFP